MIDVDKLSALAGFPSEAAAKFGARPALAVAGEAAGTLTFDDLDRRSAGMAGELVGRGVRPGDRVVLVASPGPRWVVSLFGIWRAGAVAVPLPADTAGERAAQVVDFTGAAAAVADGGGPAWLPPGVPSVVAGHAGGRRSGTTAPGKPEDLALLAFTSGSTSDPRAVELTGANLLGNLRGLLAVRTVEPGTRFLSLLPPHHLFELMVGHLGPLACGGTVVYAGAPLPNRVLAALVGEGISHAVLVPALLRALSDEVVPRAAAACGVPAGIASGPAVGLLEWFGNPAHAAARGAFADAVREMIGPSFSTIVVGGAACAPGWADLARLAGLRFETGYGLTEASPVVSLGGAAACPAGSVGTPLPGVSVRISAEGEVLVSGPGVMRGYAADAGATAEALRGGWLRTGDLGALDGDGFLFIRGRLKEAMVSATGETVCPEEVEAYYASERFADRCVVPFADEAGNDRPVLCVVAVPGSEPAALEAEFRALRAKAPARCRAGDLVIVEVIPRNASGKVPRRKLAGELQSRHAQ